MIALTLLLVACGGDDPRDETAVREPAANLPADSATPDSGGAVDGPRLIVAAPLRVGPARAARELVQVPAGPVQVLARSFDGGWLLARQADSPGLSGWLPAEVVELAGLDGSTLPVAAAPGLWVVRVEVNASPHVLDLEGGPPVGWTAGGRIVTREEASAVDPAGMWLLTEQVVLDRSQRQMEMRSSDGGLIVQAEIPFVLLGGDDLLAWRRAPTVWSARGVLVEGSRFEGDLLRMGIHLLSAGAAADQIVDGRQPHWLGDGAFVFLREDEVYRFEIDAGRETPLGIDGASHLLPSPDGRWLLVDQRDSTRVYDAGGEFVADLGSAGFSVHAWSPDGERLLLQRREGAYLVETGDWQPRLIDAAATVYGAGWAPDGRRFAIGVRLDDVLSRVMVVEADGLAQTPLAVVLGDPVIAWSADGSQLAWAGVGRGP